MTHSLHVHLPSINLEYFLDMILLRCHQRFLSTSGHVRKLNHTKYSTKQIEVLTKDGRRILVRPKIGLEVHAQVKLQSKLFSRGSNNSQASPNSQLDLLDIATPGVLPILNGAALKASILTALGLNCTVQDVINFDRKNYFYTDMPAGYQITQYYKPIARNGHIDFVVTSHHKSFIAHSQNYDITKNVYSSDRILSEDIRPYIKRSYIRQLQLEQDSAKTLHQLECETDSGIKELNDLIDYNRSGAALMEIVFEPDLENPHEASSLVKELIRILRSLGTCDCELQEGSLRVDANVSIESINNKEISREHAGRIELKNLNSLKSLSKGISYEIERQSRDLMNGIPVRQESRTYDTVANETTILRAKESSIDYRYVPEPNIPPLRIGESMIEEAMDVLDRSSSSAKLRELLTAEYKLDLITASELIDVPGLGEYFIAIMGADPRHYDSNLVADFLIYSVANLKSITQAPYVVELTKKDSEFLKRLSVNKIRQLFDMLANDEVSFSTAYDTMELMFTRKEDEEPRRLIERMDWYQINDEHEIEGMCVSVCNGMKNVSKVYRKKGEKRHMRMLLEKLNSLHGNRVNIRLAMKILDGHLRGTGTARPIKAC